MTYKTIYDTHNKVLGKLLLTSDGENLTGLYMDICKGNPVRMEPEENEPGWGVELPVFSLTKKWLDEYFSGKVPSISLPILASGTDFQRLVWELLCKIPYGETITYGALAKKTASLMGKKSMSAQAVGNAVGSNPISIIIPCHRVLGVGKKLTGYAGGIERKVELLKHEKIDTAGLIYPKAK